MSTLTESLVAVAQAVRAAGKGQRGEILAAAATQLGLSRATLYRKLGEITIMSERKQRSDAGRSALSRDEAQTLSATLMESARRNQTKQLLGIADAVAALRANGMIRAEAADPETGEIRPLAESTIARALRAYGLHPEQLLAPAPASTLASLHPNHVWQIDASLCVLYYLKPAPSAPSGLQVMDAATFYKNKPANLARVAADRVWSYEITDHASGWIYVEYVMGAESGDNLCSVLINAMQARGGADLMHGVPRILYMDPGSANTAAMTRALCRSLGIRMIAHAPGAARATGQVENARNLIERKFESGLKFQPVADLAGLNALAAKWRAHFNATQTHRRHGLSRSAAWMRITAAQLVKAPTVAVCRELAVAGPVSRQVSPRLTVSFNGREWDVSSVPGVMVKASLAVTRNPWRDDRLQVVVKGEDGFDTYHVVPEVKKNEYGFAETAAVIGESFRAAADTPAQTAKKAIELQVTGTTTQEAAAAARKAKALPFGGQLDPYKHITETELPTFMPRRGTPHALTPPQLSFAPIALVDAARRLKPMVEAAGGSWGVEQFRWLQQRYAEGVPEEALATIVAEVTGRKVAPLRAVGGA